MRTKQTKNTQIRSLAQWLIDKIDTDAYRAGTLKGGKNQPVDAGVLRELGGLQKLKEQARQMEQDPALGGAGLIWFDWENLDADIREFHYKVAIMPLLCEREHVPDPRQRQQEAVDRMEGFLRRLLAVPGPADASDGLGPDFAVRYAENVLVQLKKGERGKLEDVEDDGFLRVLYAIATLQKPDWKRKFSVRVLKDSKAFEQKYQRKIISILQEYANLDEGMNKDEILAAGGILTYSQTLEWKGPLRYILPETGAEFDTTGAVYGTVLNAQTLVHAEPAALPGVQQIVTIENKAVYEDQAYDPRTLYIYCHGFFSPKEIRFLCRLRDAAGCKVRYLHWGDMDYGGIRIFRFIEKNVFPDLEPCHMGPEDFSRLAGEAGRPIPAEKRKKLEQLGAGKLEPLKKCILETGLEIEQENL